MPGACVHCLDAPPPLGEDARPYRPCPAEGKGARRAARPGPALLAPWRTATHLLHGAGHPAVVPGLVVHPARHASFTRSSTSRPWPVTDLQESRA